MLLFTALFGGLMLLSIENRRRMVAVLLIGCIAILGVSPPPAHRQVADPVNHRAIPWRDSVDHDDQPSHRHAAKSNGS
jgi:hypothetical protein